MFPLKDNIPTRTRPYVNYAVLILCSLAFLAQLGQSESGTSLVEQYGMIPVRVLDPDEPVPVIERSLVRTPLGTMIHEEVRPAAPAAVPAWLTLLTCVFLHGGWMHFLGNMWFLWIFGDNVEDRLGHAGYAAFYLGCGLLASATHLLTGPASTIPTIGASGAIAGVMGAYLLLYPHARVLTLIPIVFIIQIIVLPAPLFLGIWFLIQLLQGSFSIGDVQSGGVAWWAHIGGFVAGAAIVWLLRRGRRLRPEVKIILPQTQSFGHYRYRPRRRF